MSTNIMSTPETLPQPATRTVEVVAPSNLAEGYEFLVDAGNNKSYKVRVPTGGVVVGQRFQAIVLSEASGGSHSIPNGHFRDGIWNCCTFGCCHPQFCLTCWCVPCALGQVLTRMKLNWSGRPLSGEAWGLSAFKILFNATVIYYMMWTILSIIYSATDQNDAVSVVRSVLGVIGFVLLVWITLRTRGHVRNKFNIPERSCNGCEDCCCAFWCNPCTVCQMARHTADYHSYKAGCCTEDGLTGGAPNDFGTNNNIV